MLDKNDKFTHLHTTIDDVAKANIGHNDGIKQNPFLEQDVHYDDGNEKEMNALSARARRLSRYYCKNSVATTTTLLKAAKRIGSTERTLHRAQGIAEDDAASGFKAIANNSKRCKCLIH